MERLRKVYFQFYNNPLATGSHVRVLETDHWITSISKYDEKARPIYSHTKNEFLSSETSAHTQFNFIGEVLETTTAHDKNGSVNTVNLSIVDKFTYDHAGRLIKQTQNIDNQGEELIVFNKYDELGQLKQKKVGGNDASATQFEGATALQNIDYNYNIRGWLTHINDVNETNSSKLFAFQLNYNNPDPAHNSTPLYNGNISEIHWRTQNTSNEKRSYGYDYDALNRITKADYLTPHAMNGDFDGYEDYGLDQLEYDRNGNIMGLRRYGAKQNNSIGIIDQLDYTYYPNSNRLKAVSDAAGDAGFKDGIHKAGFDYVYDVNGNMVKDLNKGITNIEYNHLNLPTKVEFQPPLNGGSGEYIGYTYDATGIKLEKTIQYTNSVGQSHTQYDNGFIYEYEGTANPELKFFAHAEGYVEPTVTSSGVEMSYVYQYKDHLGNIRLSYKDVSTINTPLLQIVEENNYYPFGLKHKGYNNVVVSEHPYGYLNQEEQNELGLNWLTFRYRNYIPEIGRFFGVDPVSEEYFSITTYQFAHNSPIWKIEIEGLEGEISPDIPGAVDVPNHEPVRGNTNNGSNNIVAGGVAANFGHSFLAQAFVYNYANGKGKSMTLNEGGMETVRASPVSIYRGSSSGSTSDAHRASELKIFNDAFSSLEPSESKYFETGVHAKANNQGTLGTFTIYFQGILTKDKNGVDWSFEGQMSFYDRWDFDKKEEGTRTQSSEDATAIGGKLLDGGKGFDIFSHNVNVSQSSKDNNVDWFNGKSSETKKTIHNRFPSWLTKMVEGWLKD